MSTFTIDKKYLENIPSLNIGEINWKKATKIFNHRLITQWVTHPRFHARTANADPQTDSGEIPPRKAASPRSLCYDLTQCFSQLQQLLMHDDRANDEPHPPAPSDKHNTMKPTIDEQNTVTDDLKSASPNSRRSSGKKMRSCGCLPRNTMPRSRT